MKSLISIYALIALAVSQSSMWAQPISFLGEWYLREQCPAYDLYPNDTSFYSMQLDTNGVARISSRLSKDSCHWSYDSSTGILTLDSKRMSIGKFKIHEDSLVGLKLGECNLLAIRVRTIEFDEADESVKRYIAAEADRENRRLDVSCSRVTLDVDIGPLLQYGAYRLAVGTINHTRKLSFNGDYLALTLTHANSRVYYSSNYLPIMLGPLLRLCSSSDSKGQYPEWTQLPFLIHSFANFDLSVPILTPQFLLDVAQSTDLYLFSPVCRVIPETKVGFLANVLGKRTILQVSAKYCVPWVKGWMRERANMWCVGVSVLYNPHK